MKKNVVEIEDLVVHYNQICALSHINLSIREKEFLGIIGPNGGGKSTLLKAMLGLIKPTSGSIRVLGRHPKNTGGIIGYVPQYTKFNRDFPISVMDVVLMGRLSGKSCLFHRFSYLDRSIVKNIMEKLGIYDLRDRQIGQLSGGQMQRALIARALAVGPKILVLDEPTASLDATSKSHIYSILKDLNEDITIIMVTHDMSAVSSYITSLACLNRELYYHGKSELSESVINQLYGCPIDLIAHGVPHRVLKAHEEGYHA